MAQIPAFSTFLPLAPRMANGRSTTSAVRPSTTALSPPRIPIHLHPSTAPPTTGAKPTTTTTKAVLDTPASNTYLQRHAELVLRDFLTRRAVATVMYYLHELNDGPTHNWLANFRDFSARVSAHTFRDGDRFLADMLSAPSEKATVKIGHPSGRFSRTYSFVIEPRRIAARVIAARLQLAEEWARDLACVEGENLELQRASFERALITTDEQTLASRRNLVFEADPFANDQTPLRYKNYVALKTLSTQHAVARLLPYLRDCGSNHEYMYLLQFVSGYGAIDDGDAFVSALMGRRAEMRTNPTHTILPRDIGVQVLELRLAIAKEWISVMEYIPEEHRLSTLRGLEKSMESSHDVPDAGDGK